MSLSNCKLIGVKEQLFQQSQFIPQPLEKVFKFFAEARNLEEITPPWLKFKLIEQSTPQIEEGCKLTYQLRIKALPVRWVSLIEEWRENRSFVDRQLKGPYELWHHTHEFREQDGGTLMIDKVRYILPFGPLGHFFAGKMVERDVKEIFEFRSNKIREVFK